MTQRILWPRLSRNYSPVRKSPLATVENGFYYDFFRNQPFTTEDFEAIEAEMRRIVERGDAFIREVWTREKAIEVFKAKGENFKVELIQDLHGTEDIKIYRQGDWFDLCRGPHMANTANRDSL